jgi:regulator of protease activity HflC (stomatin/prohibitin superfamily)
VQQGNVGLVTSCGKFQRKAGSGCHILNPLICEMVSGYVSTRIQQLDVSVETKTKDNVFVTCIVSVQYQVRRASKFPSCGRGLRVWRINRQFLGAFHPHSIF